MFITNYLCNCCDLNVWGTTFVTSYDDCAVKSFLRPVSIIYMYTYLYQHLTHVTSLP